MNEKMLNRKYVPTKWCELSYKDKAAYTTAIASFFMGWIMVFIGMFIPPAGEISPSVLTAFGTALVYAGGIFGVALYIKGAKAEIYSAMEDKFRELLEYQFKQKEEKDEASS